MNTATITSVIATRVFSSERTQFRRYLLSAGFDQFDLVEPEGGVYLNVQFYSKGDIARYYLLGTEHKYILSRSDAYFYDLDQTWDNDAREYFGDE
jgi:hypothetical protein